MENRDQNRKKWRKPSNRFARSAKYSEYKILQLVECFARDLSLKQAAKLTRMTERTVRDRYEDIRSKLLKWSTEQPNLFNGFGHLILDPDGNINLHVLEFLFYYSESNAFKKRMTFRYPKFRSPKDPALNHVIEFAMKRFASLTLAGNNENFMKAVKKALMTSHSETYFSSIGQLVPVYQVRKFYWHTVSKRVGVENSISIRRFKNAAGEGMFRDLKYMLRRDPL